MTENQKALLGIEDGPLFKDECEHKEGSYVATFKVITDELVTERYDLYVWQGKFGGSRVCLRYGDKPEEYLSPGPVENVLQMSTTDDVYWKTRQILQAVGNFVWKRKEEDAT